MRKRSPSFLKHGAVEKEYIFFQLNDQQLLKISRQRKQTGADSNMGYFSPELKGTVTEKQLLDFLVPRFLHFSKTESCCTVYLLWLGRSSTLLCFSPHLLFFWMKVFYKWKMRFPEMKGCFLFWAGFHEMYLWAFHLYLWTCWGVTRDHAVLVSLPWQRPVGRHRACAGEGGPRPLWLCLGAADAHEGRLHLGMAAPQYT